MKSLLICVVIFAICVLDIQCTQNRNRKHNFIFGKRVKGDFLLNERHHRQSAKKLWFIPRTATVIDDFNQLGSSTPANLTAIIVNDLQSDLPDESSADVQLIEGGIGRTAAKLKFKSRLGKGFHYQVLVYGMDSNKAAAAEPDDEE